MTWYVYGSIVLQGTFSTGITHSSLKGLKVSLHDSLKSILLISIHTLKKTLLLFTRLIVSFLKMSTLYLITFTYCKKYCIINILGVGKDLKKPAN